MSAHLGFPRRRRRAAPGVSSREHLSRKLCPVRIRAFERRTALCTLSGALASAVAGAVLDRTGSFASEGLVLSSLAASPREGRPFYLAAFALAGGVAFSASTALAGALAESLPPTVAIAGVEYANLQLLFVMTSAARFLAAWYGARIAEPGARTFSELSRLLAAFFAPLRERFADLSVQRR